jgi:hypothetical protein
MPEVNQTQVTNPNSSGVTPVVTPDASGVAPVVTPGSGPSDAEIRVAKLQEDLNRMKSSFQSTQAKLEKQWAAEKARYEADLEAARTSSMTDDQRKAYEVQRSFERLKELENRNAELEKERQETEQASNYRAYFMETFQVDPKNLILDQGIDALVASGWEAVRKDREAKEKRIAELERKVSGAPDVEPPDVVTNTAHTPSVGPTWADMIKKYGSREAVYRLFEEGKLPASQIPTR